MRPGTIAISGGLRISTLACRRLLPPSDPARRGRGLQLARCAYWSSGCPLRSRRARRCAFERPIRVNQLCRRSKTTWERLQLSGSFARSCKKLPQLRRIGLHARDRARRQIPVDVLFFGGRGGATMLARPDLIFRGTERKCHDHGAHCCGDASRVMQHRKVQPVEVGVLVELKASGLPLLKRGAAGGTGSPNARPRRAGESDAVVLTERPCRGERFWAT